MIGTGLSWAPIQKGRVAGHPPSQGKGPGNEVAYLNPLTFLFLRAFLQWQVVTGMEAEQMIESLANWFLRAPNAVCISHLLLIDRRTLWICDVINLHFWLHLT